VSEHGKAHAGIVLVIAGVFLVAGGWPLLKAAVK